MARFPHSMTSQRRHKAHDELAKAREILAEARADFTKGREQKSRLLMRDATEKGYAAVSEATDVLCHRLLSTGVLSIRERRSSLLKLEEERPALKSYGIADRLSARTQAFHERCFHGGDSDDTMIEYELNKAEEFVDIVAKELRQTKSPE